MSIPRRPSALELADGFFGSPRLASAVAVTAIGLGVFAESVQRTIGWVGFVAALITLLPFAVGTVIARRSTLMWQHIIPISLLVFVAWLGVTVLWSQYQWATLGGLAYLLAFTVLAVSIAISRDTIQIVRAFGDVLRAALGVSLVLEVVSGALIDMPIAFLGIQGNLAEFGPLQGVMGSRNQLALVAVLALVTFGTELATRSVSRGLGVGSVVGAGLVLLMTRSPVGLAVAVAVGLAVLALVGLRRVPAEHRTTWQLVTLAGVLALAVLGWLFRTPITSLFGAGSEVSYRRALWDRVLALVGVHPLEGWGWIGHWRADIRPFPAFAFGGAREPASAFNAYLDVLFQAGFVGLVVFIVLVLLAFTRSWLLAGRRRSVVFAWPALVLATLLLASFAESSMLVEYGWLAFVVCCVKASHELSWRRAFEGAPAPAAPAP